MSSILDSISNAGGAIKDGVSNGIDVIGKQLGNTADVARSLGKAGKVTELKVLPFPSDLRKNNIPYVAFLAQDSGDTPAIFLPVPAGLSFSDSASYSNIDLGIVGQIGAETIQAASKQSGLPEMAGAFAGGMAGSIVNKAQKLNAAAAASIISRNFLRMDNVANTIDFSKKQVIAPNTNTAFQNTGIRSFGFNFKLVAKSADESATIRLIIQCFRAGLYPVGDDVVMAYPPLWHIKFYNSSSEENPFIPKIYPCYLTGFSSTHNASTNAFHPDGSPIESDIQLSFQESKALTRNDMMNYL